VSVPSPIALLHGARQAFEGLRGSGSHSGRSYAVTLLAPIRPGAAQELQAHLHGLGQSEKSPLARLAHVHVGRWVVIDQLKMDWPGAPTPRPRLRSQYLLFTASMTAPAATAQAGRPGRSGDGLPQSFLRELWEHIPQEADAIWRHCLGFPGIEDPDAFVRYLAAGHIETSLFHVGYPDVTVDEVRQALAARDGLIAFARDHAGSSDPLSLQRAYLEESEKWRRST
jgi:hypothetical protein